MTQPTAVHTDPFVQQLMTKGPCYACNVGRCSSGLAVGVMALSGVGGQHLV